MPEIAELAKQNPWWSDALAIERDPKIREFEKATIKWMPRMRKHIDLKKDVLYSLRGPRQVGKTTLLKLIIRDELKTRPASSIFYFACDLITDSKSLYEIMETYVLWAQRQNNGRQLIMLDEVSRVKEWEFAFKRIVDAYSLENRTFILTGSSSWDLKHGVERLPGRKGELSGEQNHKILLPMKFAEYVEMRAPNLHAIIKEMGLSGHEGRKPAFLELVSGNAEKWLDRLAVHQQELDSLFDEYLLTGGIMSAVNQYVSGKEIGNSTYEIYLQLFFGDLAKLMREESTAKKVLAAVLKHEGKPVGWSAISKGFGIQSQMTVNQYCDVLQNLFVLNLYNAFDEETKQPRFRSEKKLQIPNPFIFHAFRGHVENPAGDYFRQSADFVQTAEGKALLVECVVGDHLSRLSYNFAPSDLFDQSSSVFYARNRKGESIDFIVRVANEFVPVEVKYQNSINPEDYKGIRKFGKGILATKNNSEIKGNCVAVPVSVLLLFV